MLLNLDFVYVFLISMFVGTCVVQDQWGDHSGLRAGRGLAHHPLHILHQHTDELHEELRRRRV